MSGQESKVPADFPLNTIGAGVDRIATPDGPFDAAGSWQNRYGVYSTAGRSSSRKTSARWRVEGRYSFMVAGPYQVLKLRRQGEINHTRSVDPTSTGVRQNDPRKPGLGRGFSRADLRLAKSLKYM